MQKFVIKHRQKRKYTKKTQETASFSVGQTLYGLLPLMVIFVTFMATALISAPFHDAITRIKFTFQFPQISLNNPVTTLQSIGNAIGQISFVLWSVISVIFITLFQGIALFFKAILQTIVMLNPQPLFLLFGNTVNAVSNGILSTTTNINFFMTGIWLTITKDFIAAGLAAQNAFEITFSDVFWFISTCLQNIAAFFQLLFHLVTSVIMTVVQTSIAVIVTIFQFIGAISMLVFHFLATVLLALSGWISAVTIAIVKAISNFFSVIFRIIEIPFKIIYLYWLQIQPYAIILGNHIQMSGSDLTNGFSSIGKVATLLSSSK